MHNDNSDIAVVIVHSDTEIFMIRKYYKNFTGITNLPTIFCFRKIYC